MSKILGIRNDYTVYGVGHKCSAMKITANLGFEQSDSIKREPIYVTQIACIEMLQKNECYGKEMSCDINNRCFYNVPLELESSNVFAINKQTIHCTLEQLLIKSLENSVIAKNCLKIDLFCSLNLEIFI